MEYVNSVVAHETTVAFRRPVAEVIRQLLGGDAAPSAEILAACNLRIDGDNIVISGFFREVLSGDTNFGATTTAEPVSASTPGTDAPEAISLSGGKASAYLYAASDKAEAARILHYGSVVRLPTGYVMYIDNGKVMETSEPSSNSGIVRLAWNMSQPSGKPDTYYETALRSISKVAAGKHEVRITELSLALRSNNGLNWTAVNTSKSKRYDGTAPNMRAEDAYKFLVRLAASRAPMRGTIVEADL